MGRCAVVLALVGVRCVVAVNKFAGDSPAELELVRTPAAAAAR